MPPLCHAVVVAACFGSVATTQQFQTVAPTVVGSPPVSSPPIQLGVTSPDSFNIDAAVQNAKAWVAANPGSRATITLLPGDYFLTQVGGGSCIYLNNADSITLQGGGAFPADVQLYGQDIQACVLRARISDDLILRNFTVNVDIDTDYAIEHPPFSQGTVVGWDGDSNFVDQDGVGSGDAYYVRLDSSGAFPNPATSAMNNLVSDAALMTYDPVTRLIKRGSESIYLDAWGMANASHLKPGSSIPLAGLLRVETKHRQPPTGVFNVAAGDLMKITVKQGGRSAVQLEGNFVSPMQNTVMEDVVIHSSVRAGVSTRSLSNLRFTRLAVTPKTAAHLGSVNRDGVYVISSSNGVVIEDSMFYRHGDDSINLRSTWLDVAAVPGQGAGDFPLENANTNGGALTPALPTGSSIIGSGQVVLPGYMARDLVAGMAIEWYQAGPSLTSLSWTSRVVSSVYCPDTGGDGTVGSTNLDNSKRLYLVTLTAPLPNTLAQGDLGLRPDLLSGSVANPFRISGCSFRDHRGRGVRIQARHGAIENNLFDGSTFQAISIGPELGAFFVEAGWPEDIRVSGNQIRNTGHCFIVRRTISNLPGAISVGVLHDFGTWPTAQQMSGIEITNNRVDNVGMAGLFMANVSGAMVKDNHFLNVQTNPFLGAGSARGLGQPLDSVYYLKNASGVLIEGNWVDSELETAGALRVDNATVTHLGDLPAEMLSFEVDEGWPDTWIPAGPGSSNFSTIPGLFWQDDPTTLGVDWSTSHGELVYCQDWGVAHRSILPANHDQSLGTQANSAADLSTLSGVFFELDAQSLPDRVRFAAGSSETAGVQGADLVELKITAIRRLAGGALARTVLYEGFLTNVIAPNQLYAVELPLTGAGSAPFLLVDLPADTWLLGFERHLVFDDTSTSDIVTFLDDVTWWNTGV